MTAPTISSSSLFTQQRPSFTPYSALRRSASPTPADVASLMLMEETSAAAQYKAERRRRQVREAQARFRDRKDRELEEARLEAESLSLQLHRSRQENVSLRARLSRYETVEDAAGGSGSGSGSGGGGVESSDRPLRLHVRSDSQLTSPTLDQARPSTQHGGSTAIASGLAGCSLAGGDRMSYHGAGHFSGSGSSQLEAFGLPMLNETTLSEGSTRSTSSSSSSWTHRYGVPRSAGPPSHRQHSLPDSMSSRPYSSLESHTSYAGPGENMALRMGSMDTARFTPLDQSASSSDGMLPDHLTKATPLNDMSWAAEETTAQYDRQTARGAHTGSSQGAPLMGMPVRPVQHQHQHQQRRADEVQAWRPDTLQHAASHQPSFVYQPLSLEQPGVSTGMPSQPSSTRGSSQQPHSPMDAVNLWQRQDKRRS